MFSIFLLKQVKYFLADENSCVILCEFLNKVYYYYYYYYYYCDHHRSLRSRSTPATNSRSPRSLSRSLLLALCAEKEIRKACGGSSEINLIVIPTNSNTFYDWKITCHVFWVKTH